MDNIRGKLLEFNSRLTELENTRIRNRLLIPGQRGKDGVQGPQGFQGSNGIQGGQSTLIGLQGHQGDHGAQGSQGMQGPQGIQGFIGERGIQGAQGFQGNQGNQGNQGTQGMAGSQGNAGLQGIQGSDGLSGVDGAQGAQGAQGFFGIPISVPGNLMTIDAPKTAGTYLIDWPMTSTGSRSPVIFITMAAGGGGSGATRANSLPDLAISPGGAGGGGGFIRRLPIYNDNNISQLSVNVGSGGFGGTFFGSGNGQTGFDSTFRMIYTSFDSDSTLLRCRGGGGGSASGPASSFPIVTGGYGGGVILDPVGIAGNTAVVICSDASGQQVGTTTIPVESSNINGYYESGSGGLCAGNPTEATPGAPGVTNAKTAIKPPLTVGVIAAGGSSGMIQYGAGANTIIYNLGGTAVDIPGIDGTQGVFILEYLF